MIQYPFVPKSTAYMQAGQFWDIPLSNGAYACGRVLQFDWSNEKKNTRFFLAGLLDWCGESYPTFDVIAGAKLLEQGAAHIKTIGCNRGMVRGLRPLELDAMTPILALSHNPHCNDCLLTCGFENLRLATLEERKSLRVHSTWGYGVIQVLAEAYFVKRQPPQRTPAWKQLF